MADIRINALTNTATSAASDDYLALDGSANGTRKILATNVAQNVTDVTFGSSGPSAKSSIAARAARQGLVFDGTAGATVASVPAFGTGDFTVVGFGFKTSLSRNEQIVGGANSSFGLIAKTDGTLITDKEGVAANTASTGTFAAGKFTQFVYSRSGTTATYYINGVSAGTTTDSQNYTVAVTDIGNSTANANSQWNGELAVYIYNRALSAAEVVALYEAGVPAGSDYASGGANNTSLITGDNSTFASDTGYWSKVFSASIGSGQCTLPTGGGGIYRSSLLTKGTKYRLSVNVITNNASGLYVQNFSDVGYGYITGTGVKTFEFTASGSGAVNIGVQNNLGATSIVIDDITIVPIGLLLAPDAGQAGGGLTWYDTSGNAANITLPSSGVTWNVPTSSYWGGQLKLQSTTGTNGLRINNISSDTFGFFGGGNDGLPMFASLNNATIGSATYGWLAFNSSATGDFELYRRNNSTTNTAALIVARSTGNLLVGGTTDTGYKLYVKGASDAQAMLDVASGSQYTSLAFANNGTGKGFVYWDNSNNALFTGTYASSAALKFNTGLGVLALTLDSSQNATFAGEVKAATQMYAEKTGAGVYGRSVGMIQQHTTVNSTTYNVTTASAKVFVISLGSGDAALCYASYKSSTITILGSDGTIVNSSTPASGELGIYKSANDHVISFKTGSAAASNYGSWGFCFVGNPVQSIT